MYLRKRLEAPQVESEGGWVHLRQSHGEAWYTSAPRVESGGGESWYISGGVRERLGAPQVESGRGLVTLR